MQIREALADSIVLDENNPAHADDVAQVIKDSSVRGDLAIVNGLGISAPAVHSAAAKVMLDSFDVEFVKMQGAHSVWRREYRPAVDDMTEMSFHAG